MAKPPPDDTDCFFELVAPALAAAVVAAWATAGRRLTTAEIHVVMQAAFDGAAGDAIREIYGADVAALIDGKKPQ